MFVCFFYFASFILIIPFCCLFFIIFIMVNTYSFRFIFVGFRRRFKVWNSKIKIFLNKTVFLNFIYAITSVKFFADFAMKTKTPNLNNLKMIDVLNLIIFASFALMQMSRNVVENSNFSKHFLLIHLNEPAKAKWKVMISFIIDFDNLIVFYSSFRFFFFSFLAFFASRSPRVSPHFHRAGGRRKKVKKSRRCVFLLNWNVFKSGHFTNFIEWNSCFSYVFLCSLCLFVE